MNPNKALWETGDFTQIAALMRRFGEGFVTSLEVVPPLRVLDLGCGDGTTALPLARLGVDVVGIDIATNLVQAGNERAAAAGLTRLSFQEGDACDLVGVQDASFDLTVSVFGAMFGPRPVDVAKEMVRVTKRGGRIVMGNWIPGDPTFVSQMFRILASYMAPPSPGFVSPMLWGVESHIVERFGAAGIPPENIALTTDVMRIAAPDLTPCAVIDIYRAYFGPAIQAFAAAREQGTAERLYGQLVALASEQNTATDGGVHIGSTFRRVEVRV